LVTVPPTESQRQDLAFAWRLVKHVKSNGIVLVQNRCMVGVGAGQTSRLDAVRIAISRARHKVKGAVMASDAFFPFKDAVEEAISAGISAIIQPGGSMRDPEVIAVARSAGIPMIFTRQRHFRH
jgi:phosphoribosylaminoimidazolecarboxamide formyltransferase/IMP cyclohydrolase